MGKEKIKDGIYSTNKYHNGEFDFFVAINHKCFFSVLELNSLLYFIEGHDLRFSAKAISLKTFI